MIISSGPLQGLTDAVFRKAHQKIWGGIDEYYGPYLRLDTHKEPKGSQIRDIESPFNKDVNYIPQLMGNNADLLIERMEWLKNLGFSKVNWNLGCPYPMVTKRNMGAGLMNQPKRVNEILAKITDNPPLNLSIKCRLGLQHDEEIMTLIDVFNQYQLTEIIIHARTASQMYKGYAKPKKIVPIIEKSKHPIAYNGDIESVESYREIEPLFNDHIQHIMLGRGLLKKPYLASAIKGISYSDKELKDRLSLFHNELISMYALKLQDHQLIMKMRGFWEYFSHSFPNQHKAYKLIKKASNIKKYHATVAQIIHQF